MSVEEELHEHAEHAREPFDKKVAASMAIIAAALAIVSVLGHMATTEELMMQQKAADQWAFSQAKNTRRYEAQVAQDSFTATGKTELAAKYAQDHDRYGKETEEAQTEAKKLEHERDHAGRGAFRLELGEVFLEVSIVLASLAILTKRSVLWVGSVAGALIGVVIACSTALVR